MTTIEQTITVKEDGKLTLAFISPDIKAGTTITVKAIRHLS